MSRRSRRRRLCAACREAGMARYAVFCLKIAATCVMPCSRADGPLNEGMLGSRLRRFGEVLELWERQEEPGPAEMSAVPETTQWSTGLDLPDQPNSVLCAIGPMPMWREASALRAPEWPATRIPGADSYWG